MLLFFLLALALDVGAVCDPGAVAEASWAVGMALGAVALSSGACSGIGGFRSGFGA